MCPADAGADHCTITDVAPDGWHSACKSAHRTKETTMKTVKMFLALVTVVMAMTAGCTVSVDSDVESDEEGLGADEAAPGLAPATPRDTCGECVRAYQCV